MQDASHPARFRRPGGQFLASCLAPVREYRLHISIPGLELEMPEEWESLMRFLEQRHADLAPRVTWDAAHLAVSASRWTPTARPGRSGSVSTRSATPSTRRAWGASTPRAWTSSSSTTSSRPGPRPGLGISPARAGVYRCVELAVGFPDRRFTRWRGRFRARARRSLVVAAVVISPFRSCWRQPAPRRGFPGDPPSTGSRSAGRPTPSTGSLAGTSRSRTSAGAGGCSSIRIPGAGAGDARSGSSPGTPRWSRRRACCSSPPTPAPFATPSTSTRPARRSTSPRPGSGATGRCRP